MHPSLRALLPALALGAFAAPMPSEATAFYRNAPATPRAYRSGHTKLAHAQPWPRNASDAAAVSAAIAKRARKNAARLIQMQRAAG